MNKRMYSAILFLIVFLISNVYSETYHLTDLIDKPTFLYIEGGTSRNNDIVFIKETEDDEFWSKEVFITSNGKTKRITYNSYPETDVDISPDGTKIIYALDKRNDHEIYLTTKDQNFRNAILLNTNTKNFDEGYKLGFIDNNHIWTYYRTYSNEEKLTIYKLENNQLRKIIQANNKYSSNRYGKIIKISASEKYLAFLEKHLERISGESYDVTYDINLYELNEPKNIFNRIVHLESRLRDYYSDDLISDIAVDNYGNVMFIANYTFGDGHREGIFIYRKRTGMQSIVHNINIDNNIYNTLAISNGYGYYLKSEMGANHINSATLYSINLNNGGYNTHNIELGDKRYFDKLLFVDDFVYNQNFLVSKQRSRIGKYALLSKNTLSIDELPDDEDRKENITIISSPIMQTAEGRTINVPIKIRNPKNIGSIDLKISYPKDILEYKNVLKGPLAQNGLFEYNEKDGNITIALVSSKGLESTGNIAYLNFKVKELSNNKNPTSGASKIGKQYGIGLNEINSNILNTVEELRNQNNQKIRYLEAIVSDKNNNILNIATSDGIIEIVSEKLLMKGDVNMDGKITSVDALLALQMAVGKITPDIELADMNGDKKVTAQDAQMILEMANKEAAEKAKKQFREATRGKGKGTEKNNSKETNTNQDNNRMRI